MEEKRALNTFLRSQMSLMAGLMTFSTSKQMFSPSLSQSSHRTTASLGIQKDNQNIHVLGNILEVLDDASGGFLLDGLRIEQIDELGSIPILVLHREIQIEDVTSNRCHLRALYCLQQEQRYIEISWLTFECSTIDVNWQFSFSFLILAVAQDFCYARGNRWLFGHHHYF